MTDTPEQPDPFVRFGFTPDEAAAFRTLWECRHIVHFLDEVADTIHDQGGTAEDCLDYIKHGVEYTEASLFYSQGFNGHHAQLIANDPTAMSNLYDRPSADIADLLADDGTPRDLIVDILRAAHTPEEAERLLTRYRHAAAGEPFTSQGVEDTPDGVIAEVAILALGLPSSSSTCGCH